MMTLEKLKEIRDGCNGVTPGPWVEIDGLIGSFIEDRREWSSIAKIGDVDIDNRHEQIRNAKHIARFDPETVHELCRLAQIGFDLENGREQYIHGVRVHIPAQKGDF